MDINCTHTCFYQQNGKCTLKEVPAFSNQTYTSSNNTDCPYYADGAGGTHSADYSNIIA